MRTLAVAVGLATALSAVAAANLQGQAASTDAQSAFCWAGQPLPACRGFALFELELGLAVASTTVPDESSEVDPAVRVFGPALEWNLGAMRNVSEGWALGATVGLGTGAPTPLTGVRVRARRWLKPRLSAEFEAGAVSTSINEIHEAGQWWGPAIGVRLNMGDDASIFTRWEGGYGRVGSDTELHQALYVGGSAGSNVALAGSLAVALYALYVTLALRPR
jgi:hypothetical protein